MGNSLPPGATRAVIEEAIPGGNVRNDDYWVDMTLIAGLVVLVVVVIGLILAVGGFYGG